MRAFSQQEQDCVEAALYCHKTCLGMAMTHCLDEGGEHVAPQHFRLMIDCAAICATAADFISPSCTLSARATPSDGSAAL